MGRGRKRHRRNSPKGPGLAHGSQPVVSSAPVGSELVPIPPEEVDGIGPLAESLLAPEIPNQDMTPEQMRGACASGQATLWMVCDSQDNAQAALVTIQAETGRCIVAICCGNNLWDYLEARHQLYAWAKDIGMKEVVYYGRDALVKLMPECKRAGVILRKEL